MDKPCKNCFYDGDNIIRCEDCERAGGIYYHYKPNLETSIANAILGEIREEHMAEIESKKKHKRSKK